MRRQELKFSFFNRQIFNPKILKPLKSGFSPLYGLWLWTEEKNKKQSITKKQLIFMRDKQKVIKDSAKVFLVKLFDLDIS